MHPDFATIPYDAARLTPTKPTASDQATYTAADAVHLPHLGFSAGLPRHWRACRGGDYRKFKADSRIFSS